VLSNWLIRVVALMWGSAFNLVGSILCFHESFVPCVAVTTFLAFVCFGVKTILPNCLGLCTSPHAITQVSREGIPVRPHCSSYTSEHVSQRTGKMMSDFECLASLPARAAVARVRAVPSRSGGENSDQAALDSNDEESHEQDEEDPVRDSQTASEDDASDSGDSVYHAHAADSDEFFCEEYNYVPILGDVPEEDSSPATRREPRKSNRTNDTDERTDDLLVNPGGEIEWSLDTGIEQKIPTAFKHRLKDKSAMRLRAKGRAQASLKKKGKLMHPFLIDSGSSVTQVPANMVHLLDDVTETAPVYFETAGGASPISKLRGTLKFKLKGIDTVFELRCLVNPGCNGSGHIRLISLSPRARL
jgi:hypothetical protein